ncbi:MAG: transporter substrate-binding domain-containing protein [Pseudomonadota bacterium]
MPASPVKTLPGRAAPVSLRCAAASLLLMLASAAATPCAPIRVGIINHERPPYYLDNGTADTPPRGASVDLIKAIADSVGCPVILVRLPLARIRTALAAGLIDFSPVESQSGDADGIAFPLDRNGQLDWEKSVVATTVVFVRSGDGLAPDTEPAHYFQGRSLGISHGTPYVQPLRQAGIRIDDGAIDVARNFDKLRRRRIDGFALTLSMPGAMDRFVETHYGKEVVRLARPLKTANVWLLANRGYYREHPEQVEAMWRWLSNYGRAHFVELIKKYSKEP